MIEKILDKYFAKKGIELLAQKLAPLDIDKQVRKSKIAYELWIKKRKYNDSYYILFEYIQFEGVRIESSLEKYMRIYNIDNKDICEQAIYYLDKES